MWGYPRSSCWAGVCPQVFLLKGVYRRCSYPGPSLEAQMVKNMLAMRETQKSQIWSLGWEDPLGKEMATHSNILAWRIPWTEEPGGSQSIGSQRVRQDWSVLACTQGSVKLTGPVNSRFLAMSSQPGKGCVRYHYWLLMSGRLPSLLSLFMDFYNSVAEKVYSFWQN